nr:leucine-rich repeat domain-containing protein [uncultured Anaerosporobacter sp.]
MKKINLIPIAIFMCTLMASCKLNNNHDNLVVEQSNKNTETTSQEVTFSNSKLEEIVQNKINKKGEKLSKRDLEEIVELDLKGSDITDLDDIEKLSNLRILDLSYTKIKDLEPLKNLKKLENLGLGENKINSLTPIQNIISLKKLNLENTNISNIESLKKMVNLEELNLRNLVSIQDLTPLKNMKNLKVLNLNGCEKIGKHQANSKIIGSLKSLTTLRIQATGIEQQMFLAKLPNLNILQADLELNNKKLLSELEISELDIIISNDTDLSGLTCLKNLEKLYILDGTLQEIPKPIGKLKNLKVLVINDRMRESTISDISCLKDLTKLEELQISGNKIKDLGPIKDLLQLIYLDLDNNNITDISILGNLINLEHLDLSDNSIKDISILKNLIHLKELNLSGNNISDTSVLNFLTNLEYQNIENQNITTD